MNRDQVPNPSFRWRRALVLSVLGAAVGLLVWRAVDLQIFNKAFLQEQGDARHLRTVPISAHRGVITDRNGEALAISTPVDSVWAQPDALLADNRALIRVARKLDLDPNAVKRLLEERRDREFVYLKRHATPDLARQVQALEAPGVFLQREYKRYYPMGEVTAHLIGFTNVDDRGQEGLELAYDDHLRGTPGAKRVIKDRLGRIVEDVESISVPRPGRDLSLSIDRRIQYLAYRELKAAVAANRARSGSLVMLDVTTGEVLAMVNQPAYNPNNRGDLKPSHMRNRAVTDVFEPGSTAKAFTVAAALGSGRYHPDTAIDTTPGWHKVSGKMIRDSRNLGAIDLATVLSKSSNVGASKIALTLPPESLWSVFTQVGFGTQSGIGFPGESTGSLAHYSTWRPIEQATLSYGYGLATTALQLAHAYSAIAADGVLRPLGLVRVGVAPAGERVVAKRVARQLREMLQAVVGPEGTAPGAQVAGYRVAGKSGTVHKLVNGAYSEDQYVAIFVGIAPLSDPRLVSVVVIDDPRGEKYYGGQVAGPVFSRVMAGALRLLDVAPDDLPALQTQMARSEVER